MSASPSNRPTATPEVIYPDSDGKPMADNTLQFRWIVTIQAALDAHFAGRPDVFVAGDLLWYPVEGDNKTRAAPDALVAFGRPKGYRGSYKQWEEGGIAPQVVFENLSLGNRRREMIAKFRFYERYGVEEYYVYDPESFQFNGWLRRDGALTPIPDLAGWVSPQTGIRFDPGPGELRIYHPDGSPFATFLELHEQREQARQEAEQARREAEQARREVEHLKARLRALGVPPEPEPEDGGA